jgi:hypothetical protein
VLANTHPAESDAPDDTTLDEESKVESYQPKFSPPSKVAQQKTSKQLGPGNGVVHAAQGLNRA